MKSYKHYLKNGFINNILWSSVGHGGIIIINFLTNLILSKLLSPGDFGKIAVISILVSVGSIVCDCGLSGALIRKKNATEMEYATVAFVNISIAVILQILLLLLSPCYVMLFQDYGLKHLINASGVVIILQAMYLTINVRQVKELEFKRRSTERLTAAILGAAVTITFAITIGGIWSMIIYMAISPLLLVLNHIRKNKFRLIYNRKIFKDLYPFGMNTTLSSLLITLYENIYQIILARYFSLVQVGYYYQAKKLQDVPCNLVNMLTQNVFYPRLSRIQDNMNQFALLFTGIIKQTTFILGFLSTFLYLNAHWIICFLYGERWLGSVYYIKLLTVGSFFFYIDLVTRLVFKIYNRTKTLLYVEIAKKIIQTILILIAIKFRSIDMLVISIIINNFLGALLNFILSGKVIPKASNDEIFFTFKVLIFSTLLVVLFSTIKSHNVISERVYQPLSVISLCAAYYIFWKKLNRINHEFFY